MGSTAEHVTRFIQEVVPAAGPYLRCTSSV